MGTDKRPTRPVFAKPWQEEEPDEGGASLRDLARREPHPDKSRILSYLERGRPEDAEARRFRDLLAPDKPDIGLVVRYEDGAWSWTNEVRYYVEHHNLDLPAEFIAHLRSNLFRVPPRAR